MKRRLLRLLAFVTALLMVPGIAYAYWTAHGSGTGAATSGTLSAPTNVTVPASSSGSVAVSWTAGSGGVAPTGYYVTRIANAGGATASACGTSATQLTTSTSCTDSGVVDGTYHYTVTAVYRTWTATSSSSGNVTVSNTKHLVFSAQPGNTSAGQAFSVSVTVLDALNNPVPTAGTTINVAIGTNPGSGTLSGTTARQTNSSGVATFPGLSINKAGTGYTLSATATGIASATSNAFNVTAAAASQLVFTQQPAGATARSAFSTQPVVAVQDAFGNVVTTNTSTISLTITSGTPTSGGPGTLSGCSSTRSSGVTTFTGCTIDTSGAGYQLRASNGTFTADSTAFPVLPSVSSLVLNNGGTLGTADKGDTLVITFAGQMDASTICSTWTNAGTQNLAAKDGVTVTIGNSGSNDVLTVTATGCPTFRLGGVALGADYVAAQTTFSGSGSNASTLSLTTGGVLTITLGTASGSGNSNVAAGTPVYTPASGIKDISGNTLSTNPFTAASASRF